jgi:N-acetylglucosaminyl-diphospho-decaprenol L-rhamnosyltransferase
MSLPSCAEVIVVDNASTDDGPAIVRRARPTAVLIERDTNDGFGSGCNVGAAYSSSDFLVFVNPDTEILGGALDILRDAWEIDKNDAVGPALTSASGELRANCRRRSHAIYDIVELLPSASRWSPPRLRRDIPASSKLYSVGGTVDYLQGACLGIGRDSFRRVGGFDTSFFLYSEEEDLCRRVALDGGRCRYIPRATVSHVAHASSSKVPLFSVYHLYRSRALLYRKWSDSRYARVAITALYLAVLADRAAGKIRAQLRLPAARSQAWVDHALRGLMDGFTAPLSGS